MFLQNYPSLQKLVTEECAKKVGMSLNKYQDLHFIYEMFV